MILSKLKKIKPTRNKNRVNLILKCPSYEIFRIKEDDIVLEEVSSRIKVYDLIDDNSMNNLRQAVHYLETEKEDEVTLVVKVKTKKLRCNYLKFIIENRMSSDYYNSCFDVTCEWIVT